MATFPSYVKVLIGSSEKPNSVMIRTEMDRGVPKHRRISSDTLVTVSVDLFFESNTEATAFESWFYLQTNGGVDFFDWTNPRTKSLVRARVVNGDIGELKAGRGIWKGFSTRSMSLEYLRSSYI